MHGPGSFRKTILFYSIALLISWSIWAPLVAFRLGYGPEVASELHLIGSLGPAIAGLILLVFQGGMTRADWVRFIWSPASLPWLILAILLPVAIGAAGLLGQTLMTGTTPDLGRFLTSKEFPTYSAVALIAVELVFYGFGEEIGWRGFLLPLLLRRFTPLSASLVITLPWAIWHLPLILSNETYQSLGVAGLFGWLISLLTGSLLLTWFYLKSGRAVLVVAVFHAAIDVVMVNPVVDTLGINIMGALVTIAGFAAGISLYRLGKRKQSAA
ncbi:CPBP family intramembrane glutamic endopeptidase [Rhizobium alvei]|uniref:CPBP family intramembrane metalloprotease n=2 Tax=Rhizobium alvei TaxID=1132659 RepID=A0ABT8YFZ8_9HYPH|nr:CPBP family intramembrane metalloprotease [Rhizobium alvei]